MAFDFSEDASSAVFNIRIPLAAQIADLDLQNLSDVSFNYISATTDNELLERMRRQK